MTTLTAFQPQPLPRLHLLDRIRQSDVAVIMSSAQFSRSASDGGQRKVFLGPAKRSVDLAGPAAIRTEAFPVAVARGSHRRPLSEVTIAEGDWRDRFVVRMEAAYGHLPQGGDAIDSARRAAGVSHLVDLFWYSIDEVGSQSEGLGGGFIVDDVSVCVEAECPSQLMLAYCRAFNADTFLCGEPGLAYLDLTSFARAGVEVKVQKWTAPVYRQSWMPDRDDIGLFLPNLSWLDALAHGVPLSQAI